MHETPLHRISAEARRAFGYLDRLLIECEYLRSYERVHQFRPDHDPEWHWAQWIKPVYADDIDGRIEIILDDFSIDAWSHLGLGAHKIQTPPKAFGSCLSFHYGASAVLKWTPEDIGALETMFARWRESVAKPLYPPVRIPH